MKLFRALIYWAHRAVFFAIAQLSCVNKVQNGSKSKPLLLKYQRNRINIGRFEKLFRLDGKFSRENARLLVLVK